MPFPNIELPADFDVPRISEKPRHCGTANLRFGPGIGRVKGKQNKICRDLKEGLLEGAILHGYDGAGEDGLIGYCHHLAERHPKAYATLLSRLLPYNLNANVASAHVGEVRIISIPSGSHLTRQALTEMELNHGLQAVPAEANLLEPTHVADVEAPALIEEPAPEPEPEPDPIVQRARNMGYIPLPPRPRPVY